MPDQQRINLNELKMYATERARHWLPLDEWGPMCAGCGSDEYRVDGFCSIDCRDYHCDDAHEMASLLALIEAVEAALLAQTNLREVLDRHSPLNDVDKTALATSAYTILKEALDRFDFT